jgi:hypothetical protein
MHNQPIDITADPTTTPKAAGGCGCSHNEAADIA